MRRVVNLLAAMGIAILVTGGADSIAGLHSGGQSVAEAQSSTAQTFSGIFAERVGDPLKEDSDGKHLSGEHKVDLALTDNRGRTTKLQLDEEVAEAAGGADTLNGKPVTVEGTKTSGGEIKVEEIREDKQSNKVSANAFEAETAVQGSQPTATVLCRFGDSTSTTPHTPTWFNTLVSGGSKPSEDNFWREVSFNNINLNGSQVFGWYNLPKPRSQYFDSLGNAKLQLLADDCTAKADPDVTFPNYPTINMMFNDDLDGAAWGGGVTLIRDGQTKTYGATWMPPWGYENVGILSHEMGHSYGLPHSSGPYGQVYDSWWDVMSSAGLGTNCNRDATYGCMAMHTISAHKDRLGWIPASRKYTAKTGSDQNVTIEQLGTSASSNYQMVKVPINGSSTVFYTLEARRFVGYDGNIKGEGIVVHRVDTTNATGLKTIAYVVDKDNNGNPNDEGAIWTAGETFEDTANQIAFNVNSPTASGYNVTINVGSAQTDTSPPTVVKTSPANGVTNANLNARINATFSEPIDENALTNASFGVYEGVWPATNDCETSCQATLPGQVSYNARKKTITYEPVDKLKPGMLYTAVLNAGDIYYFPNGAIKDLAGNLLVTSGPSGAGYYTWTFTAR